MSNANRKHNNGAGYLQPPSHATREQLRGDYERRYRLENRYGSDSTRLHRNSHISENGYRGDCGSTPRGVFVGIGRSNTGLRFFDGHASSTSCLNREDQSRSRPELNELSSRTRHLGYHAAHYLAHRRPDSTTCHIEGSHLSRSSRGMALCISGAMIPHPDKVCSGGEDAYFIETDCFGVFDGVGSWGEVGVNPGLYSRRLAQLTAAQVERMGPRAVRDALRFAVERNEEVGTSTACVASLYGTHLIGVNVGDSGLIVIRAGVIVFATRVQHHGFNFPYQLGTDSDDSVDDGHKFKFAVQHGDLIIMGSDGLWDNAACDTVVRIALAAISDKHTPYAFHHSMYHESKRTNDTAVALAKLAQMQSQNETWISPFAKNAQKAGVKAIGGKMDDVTVVVALVKH